MLEGLRQKLLFPSEFRIAAASAPALSEAALGALLGALQEANAPPPPPEAPPVVENPVPATNSDVSREALASLCLALWNTERSLTPLLAQSESEAARKTERSYRRLKENMEQSKIEIEDLTGRIYEDGMSAKALTFAPIPGLERETITETVKPAIYLDGVAIFHGEVIVGVPDKGAEE